MGKEKHYFIKIDCGTSKEDAYKKLGLLLEDGWNPQMVDLFEAVEMDDESEEE